jgi:hypothetical protein
MHYLIKTNHLTNLIIMPSAGILNLQLDFCINLSAFLNKENIKCVSTKQSFSITNSIHISYGIHIIANLMSYN